MKFFKTIALILFGFTLFSLVSLVDLKYLFPSATSVKNTLETSNIYSLLAAGIRTNLIEKMEPGAEKDVLLNVVNDAVNTVTIKEFTDSTIDQFYEITKKPTATPVITLPFSIFGDKIIAALPTQKIVEINQALDTYLKDRQLDMRSNPLYLMAANLNRTILSTLGVAVALLLILVLPGIWPQKLKWAGGAFLFSGILVSFQAALYWIGLSSTFQDNIIRASGLEDEKFLIAAQKILNTILQDQKVYFTVVAAVLLVLGIALMVWGKALGNKVLGDKTLGNKAELKETKA